MAHICNHDPKYVGINLHLPQNATTPRIFNDHCRSVIVKFKMPVCKYQIITFFFYSILHRSTIITTRLQSLDPRKVLTKLSMRLESSLMNSLSSPMRFCQFPRFTIPSSLGQTMNMSTKCVLKILALGLMFHLCLL